MITALARERKCDLEAWARTAETLGNDLDPMVKAFASLGLIAKAELERLVTERIARAECVLAAILCQRGAR